MEAQLLNKILPFEKKNRTTNQPKNQQTPPNSRKSWCSRLKGWCFGATGGRSGCGFQPCSAAATLGVISAARPLACSPGAALKPRVLLPCQNKLGVEVVRANLHLFVLCPSRCFDEWWRCWWYLLILGKSLPRVEAWGPSPWWCQTDVSSASQLWETWNIHLLNPQGGFKSSSGKEFAWICLSAPDTPCWRRWDGWGCFRLCNSSQSPKSMLQAGFSSPNTAVLAFASQSPAPDRKLADPAQMQPLWGSSFCPRNGAVQKSVFFKISLFSEIE